MCLLCVLCVKNLTAEFRRECTEAAEPIGLLMAKT